MEKTNIAVEEVDANRNSSRTSRCSRYEVKSDG